MISVLEGSGNRREHAAHWPAPVPERRPCIKKQSGWCLRLTSSLYMHSHSHMHTHATHAHAHAHSHMHTCTHAHTHTHTCTLTALTEWLSKPNQTTFLSQAGLFPGMPGSQAVSLTPDILLLPKEEVKIQDLKQRPVAHRHLNSQY